jgi:sarcosine oxidase/L-pipecolate oxidase
MRQNDLFSKKQFGFITGRSTTLQLLEVLDKWTQAVDSFEKVDCIYMDFQKAFDKVPHKKTPYSHGLKITLRIEYRK